MESNKPNAENSTISETLNIASTSTLASVPRDGSSTESIVCSILSQIQERRPAYQEIGNRYHALFSAYAASGERMTDVVNTSTQTLISAREGDLEKDADDGQNVNRENMSHEALLEHHKRINVGLRVRAFYLSIKLHIYELPKSSCLDNEDHLSIFLEDYCDKDELTEIDCGHVFHVGCIKEWIKLKNSCPICKMDAFSILT